MTKSNVLKLSALSALIGLIIGLASDLFIRAIQLVSYFIWHTWIPNAHDQPLSIILISVAGGLAMGICVKYFGKNDKGIGFDAVMVAVKEDGELGFKQIKRVVVNAYAGLVTGASIGPESPLITIGGYCGNVLARWLKMTSQQLKALITIALGGSMGVLVNSPVAGPILLAEQPPTTNAAMNRLLVFTSMVAASVGFAVYYFLGAPLLENEQVLPAYTNFQAIHLLYGLLLGLIGTLVGLTFKFLILSLRKISERFDKWPVYRGILVGLIIGVLALVSPLVRFDGSSQLIELVANASAYSVLGLLLLALVRLVSTSVALGGGYQGGNIFPSIFISGAIGLAIHAMFDFIPAPVAMVALMTSTMYVFAPMTLFCIFLFTEIGSFNLIPVMAMSLVGSYLFNTLRKPLAPGPKMG